MRLVAAKTSFPTEDKTKSDHRTERGDSFLVNRLHKVVCLESNIFSGIGQAIMIQESSCTVGLVSDRLT